MNYIGVIGAGLCSDETARIAEETGRAVARAGAVLVCGGMGGVMHYASKGAFEAGGVTIGVLPTGDRNGANPYLTYSIPTGLGEARNSIVARTADALIAIDGSFGTLSEIAFGLIMGKPVVGIGTWKLTDGSGTTPDIIRVDNPIDAVKEILKVIGK